MLVIDEVKCIQVETKKTSYIAVVKRKDGMYSIECAYEQGYLQMGNYYTEEMAKKVFKDIVSCKQSKYILPVQKLTTLAKFQLFSKDIVNCKNEKREEGEEDA